MMQVPFVDLKNQYYSIKNEIDGAIHNVITEAAFIGGKFVKEFESHFSNYVGVSHCVSCGNGTDAIFIALKGLGIGPGDEVVVPANSFIATSEAVTQASAKVVFVDVDEKTNNINVTKIEEKINKSTKAIIAVHLYGQPANMEVILDISKKYNLYVIEDAAQAHGAKYKNKRIGTFGNAACFSFYPGKNLGAYGDAGAIVTNDENLARNMKMYANHGRFAKYNHEFEGINSRMDGLQAALLSVKLKHIDKWTRARRNIAERYMELLTSFNEITLPTENEAIDPVYHLFVIKTSKRNELQEFLKEKNIATGIHYPIGLPFLNAYRYLNHKINDFPVTAKNQNRILSLPIYPEMTEEQLEYTIQNIRLFYNLHY